jgi:Uncharacterised protein family UPF0547
MGSFYADSSLYGKWRRSREEAAAALGAREQNKIVIKTYRGSQDAATSLYRADSAKMAALGYSPTSQSWAPGQRSFGDFLGALLLCFILIGFLVFIYMLIVKPPGTLSVTYELRTSDEEKTCPKCAEQIKAAALVCRFCRHEFVPVQQQQARERSLARSKMGAGGYKISLHTQDGPSGPLPKSNLRPQDGPSGPLIKSNLVFYAVVAICFLLTFNFIVFRR